MYEFLSKLCVIGLVISCSIALEISSRDDIACTAASQPRVLNDPSGTFTSQNFPTADYPNDANCQWLIVAQPGQIVNLDFSSFATQRGFDRVWIHDGDSTAAPVILGLDGTRSPAPANIHSSQRNMFVIFTSDATTTAAGFSATYTSIDPEGIEDACSLVFRPRQLNSYTGTITSQFFPDPYPFGSTCEWLIVSQETNGFVQLDFNNFLTEPNADWVYIYDGNSDAAPLLARLSGVYATLPGGFKTTQRNMFVRFTSDLQNSVRGFNATFTSTPTF